MQAMTLLAKDSRCLFLGQDVVYAGTSMHRHLAGVPRSQRIEMPVAEDLQMGISTGLALQGFLPVSVYPRMDFLMRAMDQLVNHLDKLDRMSKGQFRPKVIIRTRVGGKTPLDAGPQHTQDHTLAFKFMLENIEVSRVFLPKEILPTYEQALERKGSTLVVESLSC